MIWCLFVLLFPSLVFAGAAEDDYATRKAGAVYAVDFDTIGSGAAGSFDIITGGAGRNTGNDGLGVNRISLDTNIKRSGAGSMRIHVPPPPHAGANIGGQWKMAFSPGFGPGDPFYSQYAVRWSRFMIEDDWPDNNSWKAGIFCYNTCPCAEMGIVDVNWNHRDIYSGYTNCGDRAFLSKTDNDFSWITHQANALYKVNAHDYNCRFQTWPSDNCFKFKPNVWHHIYKEVLIGTWGGADSLIKVQIWTEGVPVYKTVVHLTDMTFNCNNPPCDGDPDEYNNVEFGVYMTGLPTTAGLPYDAYVWYDELIVSSSPIPAPAVKPADSIGQIARTGGFMSGGGMMR